MRHPEKYYWIQFTPSSETAESDQFLLTEWGALGTEEDSNPAQGFESGSWIRGFFAEAGAWQAARLAFANRPGLEWGEIPWEDWDQSWRDRQTPVKVSSELAVCPPWVPSPPFPHVIRLEAKMAFGTGSHESTRIAANLLEGQDLRGLTVLDVGCGTGILCLYAAQRGAMAVGFDIDPVTGPCLRENLDLNPPPFHAKASFFVGTLEALTPKARFHALVCNMIRSELWPLLPSLCALVRPGGFMLFSGQRVEDKPHWKTWLHEEGLHPTEEITLDSWWGFATMMRSQPAGPKILP